MKLVYLEWEDAATTRGWSHHDDNGLMLIRSVGWLLKQNKQFLTLTTSESKEGRVLDAIAIPKHSITKFKILKRYPT